MRTMKLALIAIAAAALAPQLSSARPGMKRTFAPGDADERVPFIDTNPNDPKYQYPLWTPEQTIFPGSGTNRVGVDDDFVVHVIGVEVVGGVSQIMYANNKYETRATDQSGFSAHVQVSSATAAAPLHGTLDMAVAPDGTTHIVWAEYLASTGAPQPGISVKYRSRAPDGTWSGISTLATGSSTFVPDPYAYTFEQFFSPVIGVSAAGATHIAWRHITESGLPVTHTEEIIKGSAVDSTTVVGDGFGGPYRMKVAPNGDHFFTYDKTVSSVTTNKVFSSTGGISDPTGGNGSSVAIGASPTTNLCHVAWTHNSDGKVRYGLLGGATEIPTDAQSNQLSGGATDVHVDSRNQPILVGGFSIGAFAAKVTKVGSTTVWGFGPGPAAGSGPGVIDSADVVHSMNLGWYARTTDFNLGGQDSYAMLDGGPAMSANAANGNLTSSLPLFSSRGAGFATAVTLYYNTLETDRLLCGKRWSHNWDITLEECESGVSGVLAKMRLGDGRRVYFGFMGNLDRFDFMARVVMDSPTTGQNTVITRYGMQYIFRTDGKLDRIKDTNANEITCSYNGSGQLQTVTDSVSRSTTFTYDATSGLLDKVTDPGGREYKLDYDTSKRLIRVHLDNLGFNLKWEVDYHASDNTTLFAKKNLVKQVRTPRGVAGSYGTDYEYYPDRRLRRVVDPTELSVTDDGNIDATETSTTTDELITYEDSQPPFTTVPRVLVRDRRQNTTTLECAYPTSVVTKVTDPGSDFIERKFSSFRALILSRDKRGAKTRYAYSAHAGAPPTSDGGWDLPIVYPANLRKIRRPKVLNGNETNLGDFLSPIEYEYVADTLPQDDLNRVLSVKDAKGAKTEYEYDPGGTGNLTRIKHPSTTCVDGCSQQGIVQFTYTTMGRVQTITDSESGVTTFGYSGSTTGLATSVQENGQSVSDAEQYGYDAMGYMTARTKSPNNQGSRTTTVVYDTLYRIDKIRDELYPATGEVDYTYDADSNVTQIVDRRLNPTSYVFDKLGRMKTITAPAGTSSFQYDRNSGTRRSTDARSFTTKTLYDTRQRTTENRRPAGSTQGLGGATLNKMTYTYDAAGNVLTSTSNGTVNRTTQHQYDPRSNTSLVTDPISNLKTEMHFDDNDNTIAVNRLDGTTFKGGTFTDYDEANRPRRSIQLFDKYQPGDTCEGPTTSVLFDKNGNRSKVWNPRGNPLSTGSADSTTYVYDKRQRLLRTLDGTGRITSEVEYYEDGSRKKLKVQDPAGGGLITQREFTYTKRGEVFEEIDNLGKKYTHTYDNNGNLTKRTDPTLKDVDYTFDSSDRVQTETRYSTSLNIVTTYGYDANSNRTSITVFNPATGANDAVYQFFYTEANRLEKLIYPNTAHVETWTYNDHGETATHTDANGKTVTYGYDDNGRLLTEAHGAPFNVTITRQWDGAGNLTQIADGTTTIDMGYDILNRMTSSAWTVGGSPFKSITYGYDEAGNRISMSDPENAFIGYTYDDDNRLATIARNGQTFATFAYDDQGRRKSVTLKNASVIEYEYTSRDELKRVRTRTSGGVVLASFSYEYNDKGERTRKIAEHWDEDVTYGYDDASRLTSETSTGNAPGGGTGVNHQNQFEPLPGGNESGDIGVFAATPSGTLPLTIPPRTLSWIYDKAGNRTSQTANSVTTTYVYDNENRLTSETTSGVTISYGYNNNGNQTSRTQGTTVETYGYDYANRLTSYVKQVGGPTTASYTYSYTPSGERLKKFNVLANTTEWYMNDHSDVQTDYTQSGAGSINLQFSYVQSTSIDAKVARITTAGGAEHFYVPDALGSAVSLIDSSQAVTRAEVTDAWGKVIASLGTADRYGYTQRERDDESVLMHYRARSYDARIGRFIQMDPLLANRHYAHYRYASDDPARRADPTGLQDVSDLPQNFRSPDQHKRKQRVEGARQETILKDIKAANDLIDAATTVLKRVRAAQDPARTVPSEAALVREWFGPADVDELIAIEKRFSNISHTLTDMRSSMLGQQGRVWEGDDARLADSEKGARAESFAQPVELQPGSLKSLTAETRGSWWYINFYDAYWSQPRGSGNLTAESVLLHEASHLTWGSKDKHKGNNVNDATSRMNAARAAATNVPAEAKIEASNYQFFAERARDLLKSQSESKEKK